MGGTRRDLLLGTAAVAVAACQSKPQKNSPRSTLGAASRPDSVARALHAASPTPALSLAVARKEGIVWASAYGKADIEFGIDATTRHRFRLGSVSKVLTATTAAKLARRGVIDLDAPITTWLSDLPEPHRQTTLKMLLTHRGGIRHYIARDQDYKALNGALDRRPYPTNKEILATFIDDPLVAPVGAEVHYSTFGYTLASLAMEVAATRPFPELVRDEIGTTMGLGSLDADDPVALRPMRVSGYGKASDYRAGYPLVGEGWANARQINPAYKWAGGGFIMTPSDVALFGAAHLDPSKVTPEESELLFTPIVPEQPNQDLHWIGLGWRVDKDAKGRRRWHHAGNQEGARASLVIYPDLGLSIAFATNLASTPADTLKPSSDLADAFI
jgi:serine beta-lactamase-like protein LACTB